MERVVVTRDRKQGGIWRRPRFQGVLALGLLLGAAACESGTAPGSLVELDTNGALADYQTVARVLSSQGFAGFQALEGRTPFASPSGARVVAGLAGVQDGSSGRAFVLGLMEDVRRARGESDGRAAARILSDRYLGKTFVYDRATDEYIVDPQRSGAPATGVRFVLYASGAAGKPDPAREIGYADLVDEGAGAREDVRLRWIVVEGSRTILDYRTTVDNTEAFGRVTVDGVLLDEGARLDFSVELKGRTVGGRSLLDMTFDLRVDSRDFRVTGEVRDVEEGKEGGDGSISLKVKHRTQSLEIGWRVRGGTLDGTIRLNGALFASFAGDPRDPVVKGAGGHPVTEGEATVVLAAMATVEDVFDLVGCLLDPVHDLVVLK